MIRHRTWYRWLCYERRSKRASDNERILESGADIMQQIRSDGINVYVSNKVRRSLL